jgi:VanZ family protein
MSQAGHFLGRWLPAVLWMGLIFEGSTDVLSTHNTSRFIVPLLRWLNPDISEPAIDVIQTIVRKGGHLTEYGVLAMLVWRALSKPAGAVPSWHFWPWVVMAVGVSALYAISDEFHQSFYPSRQASGWDVLIDSVGACIGMGLVWLYYRWRRPQSSSG